MAKKKDCKVSIASVDRLLKAVDTDTVPVHVELEGESIDFEVKRLLDIGTFRNMVNEVSDVAFFADETGDEQYDAALKQYAMGVAMLTYVANFKPETASDKLYKLIHCQNVMNAIRDVWDRLQYDEFWDAVEEQIEFKKQELLASERRKLQEVIDRIDKANDIFVKFVEMFKDVDPNQLMEQMQKISNLSEEQIGAAVVRARDEDFVEQRKAELQVLK